MQRGADERALLALLRVDEKAPWQDVRRAFRDAVRASHPDLHPGDADAERRLKALNAARLRVQRQQRGSAGLLNWWLELDSEVVASIENGGVSVLEATPGRHSLRVFYGAHSSLPLQVELHRGQELLLGCRQLRSLRISLFSPQRSLVLELLNS